ncbi:MAG: hypothetical protein FD170_812 [Bacteroidetes bacterium]|nr:MAG: hypothetical protein FD170_812 [Bacteroidota bacterium]
MKSGLSPINPKMVIPEIAKRMIKSNEKIKNHNSKALLKFDLF